MSKLVEEWRPIVGYEGLYEVSDWGRVKSLDRYKIDTVGRKQYHKGKVNRLYPTTNGYIKAMLYKDGVSKNKSVHRLVAEAFIPNPNNLPLINHKDEDKTNNSVENLEWCDLKYNVNYGTAIERCHDKQKKPIIQMTMDGEIVKEYESITDAVNCGFLRSKISLCCNGKRKSSGGFRWKFK